MEMENHGPNRRWENIDGNVLLTILKSFDLSQRTSVAHVCKRWRSICRDPCLWMTVDLSIIRSLTKVNSTEDSIDTLTNMLKLSLSLSNLSIKTLIFPYTVHLGDELFIYAVERRTRLTEEVMCRGFQGWRELESLLVPPKILQRTVLTEISAYCKIKELKILTGMFEILPAVFDMGAAELIAEFLPTLRVLCIPCSNLEEEVLIFILEKFKDLEVLDVSHCLLTVPGGPPPLHRSVATEFRQEIRENASRLRKFITCMTLSCTMCRNVRVRIGSVAQGHEFWEAVWEKLRLS